MNKEKTFVWVSAYDNENESLIPEVWAQESLEFLEKNMVAGLLVHRDFENEVARAGDVVNTRRPAGFTAKRKTDGDDIVTQDAKAPNIPIRLDQHFHTSFIIYDGEESKSMADLIEFHAQPAISSIAEAIDQVVIGECYNFIGNSSGRLGVDVTGPALTGARAVLTNNKAPLAGRNLLVTPDSEGVLLNIADFVNANTVGDDGSALREGHLGRKYGFDVFTAQNVPAIAAGNTVQTGTVDGGHAAGSTVIDVEGFGGILTRGVGAWVTIAGDNTPQRITALGEDTGASETDQITITPGLKNSVVGGAVVTVYTPGRINESTDGYAAGYSKELTVKDFSVKPQVGQLVSLGADYYGAIGETSTTKLTLNRSLDTAAAHEATVAIGPAGQYNFAFHRNAIALVTRPLAMVRAGAGAASAVANYNGLSCRVTIGYDMVKQGHRVTLDILAGIKTLDKRLGCLVYA